MISAGLEGRLPYMTYPEPWRGPPKQPPEFLRPAPKPVPSASRYNGLSTSPNGLRLAPSAAQRPISKYPSPPSISAPVNLTQHKDDIAEELPSYYRLHSTPPHISAFPQYTMYQGHYPSLIRSTFSAAAANSLQLLENYSPPTSTTFLSPPPSTFSPPSPVKAAASILRENRTATPVQQQNHPNLGFKVPSGKEGSLKHRILTRPEDGNRILAMEMPRRRLGATLSPPRSPKRPLSTNILPSNFTKGSLIQLTNGELRKIEDMRTEDFVSSAENSLELRLAESTVVRIEENPANGTASITLCYNQRRAQVEFEAALEHPFFVFGQGWASCGPEKTLQCYRLKVHRLQVGDILISLTPRQSVSGVVPSSTTRTTTVMTTATSTAMTVRPLDGGSIHHNKMQQQHEEQTYINQVYPINLHHHQSADMSVSRKRSNNSDEDEQHSIKRHRVE